MDGRRFLLASPWSRIRGVSCHRLLLCAILLYFTIDLSLTMMPEVYESDLFLDGTQAGRSIASSEDGVRLRPAVEPPVPKPFLDTEPDFFQAQHLLPRGPVAFNRPRAALIRSPLDREDPH
jgi:hypothetical protein